MTHEPSCAFEQTRRVGELGAAKESNVHVRREHIDVAKGRISDACRGMSVVQQLAKGLEVSAESLYVRAGILDAETATAQHPTPDVRRAIADDPLLTERQKKALLDIYESYVEKD